MLAVTKVWSGGSTPMIFWMRKLLPVPAPPVMNTFLPPFTHSSTHLHHTIIINIVRTVSESHLCSCVITAPGSALSGLLANSPVWRVGVDLINTIKQLTHAQTL